MTNWKQPLLSVDVLALRVREGAAHFATHERLFEPFSGHQALPGVLLLSGESLEEAAHRAASEKLGAVPSNARLWQFGAFDGTARDPRGATISVAHLMVISEATELTVNWHEIGADQPDLPFDHNLLVSRGIATTADRLWRDMSLTRALVTAPFTTSQVLAITKQLGGQLPARDTNMGRWLAANGAEKTGMRGRDTVWRWAA